MQEIPIAIIFRNSGNSNPNNSEYILQLGIDVFEASCAARSRPNRGLLERTALQQAPVEGTALQQAWPRSVGGWPALQQAWPRSVGGWPALQQAWPRPVGGCPFNRPLLESRRSFNKPLLESLGHSNAG